MQISQIIVGILVVVMIAVAIYFTIFVKCEMETAKDVNTILLFLFTLCSTPILIIWFVYYACSVIIKVIGYRMKKRWKDEQRVKKWY